MIGQTSGDLLIGLQRSEPVERPRLLDPPLELQMHDELVLAAKELHQELHEDVENVGLVDIANHVAKQGPLGVENGEQGCALVDLDQQEQQVSVRAFIEQILQLTGIMARMRMICS